MTKNQKVEKHEMNPKKKAKAPSQKKGWVAFIVILFVVIAILHFILKQDIVAKINGESITKEDFDVMYIRLTEKDPAVEKEVVLEQLIGNRLVAQDAINNGITVSDEEIDAKIKETEQTFGKNIAALAQEAKVTEKQFRAILKEHLLIAKRIEQLQGMLSVVDAEAEDYYTKHPEQFTVPKVVEISQIVVGTDAEGNKVYQRLQSGESFESLAKELSIETETSKNGGYAGFIQRNTTSQKIWEAINVLEENEFSKPVSIFAGVYIFKAHKIQKEGKITLEEARETLKQLMLQEKKSQLLKQYVQQLYKQSNVKVYKENL